MTSLLESNTYHLAKLRGIKDPEIEAREDERLEANARQQEQDERYES